MADNETTGILLRTLPSEATKSMKLISVRLSWLMFTLMAATQIWSSTERRRLVANIALAGAWLM
jgi:hypothetical protein